MGGQNISGFHQTPYDTRLLLTISFREALSLKTWPGSQWSEASFSLLAQCCAGHDAFFCRGCSSLPCPFPYTQETILTPAVPLCMTDISQGRSLQEFCFLSQSLAHPVAAWICHGEKREGICSHIPLKSLIKHIQSSSTISSSFSVPTIRRTSGLGIISKE